MGGLALPGEEDERRLNMRGWLAAHPSPTGRQLAEAGFVAPHWPRPWGLDADPLTQLVIDDELRRAGVRRPINPIGIGWAGPTILAAGTEQQKERWLMPLLAGEEIWCQLFSEPESGSDLASLRTSAVRDGDEWIVRGSKVWTSLAHVATYGILLARSDPQAEPHHGISYFVCPMQATGVTVRPLLDMTGTHAFNEVFLDDVRLPSDHLVGEPHRGWGLARITLANERVSLSSEGAFWGSGPTARDVVALAAQWRDHHGGDAALAPAKRDRLARSWVMGEVLSSLRARQVSASLSGRDPGPSSSLRKALADDHGQELLRLARDMSGAYGLLDGRRHMTEPGATGTAPPWWRGEWDYGFSFSPALTIGGGTAEVQRNIIAERLLGLPRDER